ncbi:MAG TPA: nuclear transport factor 2 family protein [Gemmatimonadaceae bacterium]|nr:nuclear transport factor 2 family protein [Gemmatimonadaceae bacterium]
MFQTFRTSLAGAALVAGATLPATAYAQATPPAAEEAAVRRAVEHYFMGHATGDGSHFRAAFHPVANLYFVRDGKLMTRTGADYIAGARGAPSPDESRQSRVVERIDVTGTAAVAKLVLDGPEAKVTDYMALLKTDGEWKIVSKIFFVERKAPPGRP